MIKAGLSALLLLATILGLYNVYAEDDETLNLAERIACGSHPCVRLLNRQKTPVAQSFVFQSQLVPQRTSQVECRRAYLLLGSMSCTAVPVRQTR